MTSTSSVGSTMASDKRPLVLHMMHRFDTGGLENGVANLINHMPEGAYRHAVLALTEVTGFQQRIQRRDVEFISLRKPPGHGIWQYPTLLKLFQQLRPDIVHSRNLAALEMQVPAWAAGVPVRIHGEHGRDLADLGSCNVTYQRLRRCYRPFIHHYTALSHDLAEYLVEKVNVPTHRITRACNGVDSTRFFPAPDGALPIASCPFDPARHWIVGTVGRMVPIKDQALLADAFVHALAQAPDLRHRMRLVMVGEGPVRGQALAILEAAGVSNLAWLPGERTDVEHILRGLHVFALPSLSEGISNSILEAMASGLPVIATNVGGNADLVVNGHTGHIVPCADLRQLTQGLLQLAMAPDRAQAMGVAGRERVLSNFSLQAMVQTYQSLYDQQIRLNRAHQR